jgi:radical SAM superfamily enzyme YgiQ (UPF0313 family)
MNKYNNDIILIHPPYVLNKEKYAIFPMPWNLSHVGSTDYIGRYPVGQAWNIEPLGFYTMKNFIKSNSDYTVDIVNLASLKHTVPESLIEKFKNLHMKDRSILSDLVETIYPRKVIADIKNLKAELFAVDLHWLNYSQGAIEILKLLKQIHPDSYTVVGGLTASYFKDEIMKMFSFIDFLIAGDGCVPLLKLITQIKSKKDFSKIPNLSYRENGLVKKGPIHFLNDFDFIQNKDKPVSSIPAARGCPLQCITCGGSKYAFKNISNYKKIQVYSVEFIMKHLFDMAKEHKEKQLVFLIHDPFFTLGKKSWAILLDEIKRNRLNIRFLIEFFAPHSEEEIHSIAEKVPGSTIHISPESMDAEVRTFHKNLKYTNRELIMNMDIINNIDDLSMQIWFMAGLAKETRQSIDKTLSFVEGYFKKLRNIEKNSIKYNELLFIDPGSFAFDFPHKCGYELINKSFLSHMESFEMPIFKYQINYRTEHQTRDQIFDSFIYMHNKMNKIYYENDVISKRLYDRATLYNILLEKYSVSYDEALLEKDKIVRNKYFVKIGNLFRSELEK